jgi:hypothetical protein
MEKNDVIKEKVQALDGFKVIKKQNFVETYNNLNQQLHFIDLSFAKVGIFHHGWVGFRTNSQMKEILEGHFYEFYDELRCPCLLTDCTKMRGSFIDLVEWLTGSFMPSMAELGLKNHSIVLPMDAFAQLTIKDWIKRSSNIKTKAFPTLSEAINWLALV